MRSISLIARRLLFSLKPSVFPILVTYLVGSATGIKIPSSRDNSLTVLAIVVKRTLLTFESSFNVMDEDVSLIAIYAEETRTASIDLPPINFLVTAFL